MKNRSSECTCNEMFRDAEDFRDHLPCEGTAEQQKIASLESELAKLVSGIRVVNFLVNSGEDINKVKVCLGNLAEGKAVYTGVLDG